MVAFTSSMRLAQADHDPGLGEHVRVEGFGLAEDGLRPLVVVLRLDELEQPRHGLDVVVEDFRAGIHHHAQRLQAALEIRDEHLDRAAGMELADAADDHGKDRRAAVLAVVPVDAGDHGVLQIHGLDRLGDPLRLQPVQRAPAGRA